MVKFLFTSFPVRTEIFLQREVETLKVLGFDFEVDSLWGGKKEWGGISINLFSLWKLIRLIFELPYWVFLKPKTCRIIVEEVLDGEYPNLTNCAETFLGLAYAFSEARYYFNSQIQHIHAVWASAPATAALSLHRLTGIPFSFAGHAYDLFEGGGDALLEPKIKSATFIRSSTEKGCNEFLRRGAEAFKVHLIRRGLPVFPAYSESFYFHTPLRILSVGRLVEKMGHFELLKLLRELKDSEILFDAKIIGGGILERSLKQFTQKLGLENSVKFTGSLEYPEVEKAYQWADLLIFTGIVSKSGDQAGLPNAVAEAMAWGVPVFVNPVGAVTEAIIHEENGYILNQCNPIQFIGDLARQCKVNPKLVKSARNWVEKNYNSQVNCRKLMSLLELK